MAARPITAFFKPATSASAGAGAGSSASSSSAPAAAAAAASPSAGAKRKRDDGADDPVDVAAIRSAAAGEASASSSSSSSAAAAATDAVPAAPPSSSSPANALAALGIDVHPSWAPVVAAEAAKPYFPKLLAYVAAARAKAPSGVYPPQGAVFAALQHTPLESVAVVITGQDPYHGPGQAHGLAFSVPRGVPPPPSLKNMLKEAADDVGTPFPPPHGDLRRWAAQGVLLLNAVLTVERGAPQSHAEQGWERFTQALLGAVVRQRSGVVFMLWGKPAQEAAARAGVSDGGPRGHRVLHAPHPSPLSAYRGFFGCRHFSAANAHLAKAGRRTIDWRLDGALPGDGGGAGASSSSAASVSGGST